MASKEVDRQLLFAYLEGNCSRDQLLQIREYLHDEAYRDSLNQFMEEEWENLNRRQFPPLPGMEDKYRKFSTAYIAPRNRTTLPVRVIRRMATIAATLLLGAVGVWLLLSRLASRQAHDATERLSWHNEPGQHREILLPDSTRVYLGPAGTLRYWQNDDRSRLVQLEGEAYFVVRHDPRRPFTVVTGALSTRDIGTEFNIRYYPGEPTIAIAVASGKVQVLHTPAAASSAAIPEPAPLAALTAGQLLQYDSLTQRSGITDVSNPSVIGAWRKGILSFRRQRLQEVTDELQRYYGVSFRYSDSAAKDILITTLLDDQNLGDALDIVSITAGVHFIHEGNEILIK
jgi:ferric-dicitrate binding protein FerR (iron transport regulator)